MLFLNSDSSFLVCFPCRIFKIQLSQNRFQMLPVSFPWLSCPSSVPPLASCINIYIKCINLIICCLVICPFDMSCFRGMSCNRFIPIIDCSAQKIADDYLSVTMYPPILNIHNTTDHLFIGTLSLLYRTFYSQQQNHSHLS